LLLVEKLTSLEGLRPMLFCANTANRYSLDGYNSVIVKVGLKLVPIGCHPLSQCVPSQLLHFEIKYSIIAEPPLYGAFHENVIDS
jgi:hypothetical protein